VTIIHLEIEDGRLLVQKIQHHVFELEESRSQINRTISYLPSVWDSQSAHAFVSETKYCLRNLNAYIEDLEQLCVSLQREIDQWVQVDQQGPIALRESTGFKGLWNGKNLGVYDYAGLIGGSIGIGAGIAFNGYQSLDMRFWQNEEIDDFLNIANEIPYDSVSGISYKGIGRTINDQLIDNVKGGAVGKCNRLGHLLKSTEVQWGVPIVMETFDGISEGESAVEAVGSAVLKEGISKGIEYGVAALIPGFGQAMLVSSVVQIAGNGVVTMLEKTGQQAAANIIETGLDYVDIGGYVDSISDGITDMVVNFVKEDVLNIPNIDQSVDNFTCGLRGETTSVHLAS
jgi:uncharacterized protein YukE